MEQHLIKKSTRIEVVDALRGFAVMAIILVHNLEHFIFPVYPADSPGWLNVLDQGVFNVTFSLFAGKAYAIFALLFGFTFYIQSSNQKKQGKDFGYRFLWRLVLLVGFATLNAAWINPAHQLPDLKVGEMYAEVAAYTKAGDFWPFVWGNITLGQKASLLWAVNAGRFFQTAGLFLLGFYMGRKQLFLSSESNLRLWTKTLIISAVSFAPLYTLKDLIMKNDAITQQTVGTVFDMWQKLAFTLVLVASFVLLYQNEKFCRIVGNLRFYGRMSLTNYIAQSVMGAVIYFPFGLSLAPHCGYAVSLLVGVLTFLLQVQCCKWWLGKHKQGPLEQVWHKWTWLGTGK